MSIESAREFVEKLRDPDSPEAQAFSTALQVARESFVGSHGYAFSVEEFLEALLEALEDGLPPEGIIFSEPPGL
jgi:hypothetical protein